MPLLRNLMTIKFQLAIGHRVASHHRSV